MSFKLWNNIKVWQKVLLNRWEKVLGVTNSMYDKPDYDLEWESLYESEPKF